MIRSDDDFASAMLSTPRGQEVLPEGNCEAVCGILFGG